MTRTDFSTSAQVRGPARRRRPAGADDAPAADLLRGLHHDLGLQSGTAAGAAGQPRAGEAEVPAAGEESVWTVTFYRVV